MGLARLLARLQQLLWSRVQAAGFRDLGVTPPFQVGLPEPGLMGTALSSNVITPTRDVAWPKVAPETDPTAPLLPICGATLHPFSRRQERGSPRSDCWDRGNTLEIPAGGKADQTLESGGRRKGRHQLRSEKNREVVKTAFTEQTLLVPHQISVFSIFPTHRRLILFRKTTCLVKNIHLPRPLACGEGHAIHPGE